MRSPHQELHDVLAHNISLINVQAATTLHRAERNEERAYEALATIKKVTNVARHAGTGAADVTVEYRDTDVVVQVDDDGPSNRV